MKLSISRPPPLLSDNGNTEKLLTWLLVTFLERSLRPQHKFVAAVGVQTEKRVSGTSAGQVHASRASDRRCTQKLTRTKGCREVGRGAMQQRGKIGLSLFFFLLRLLIAAQALRRLRSSVSCLVSCEVVHRQLSCRLAFPLPIFQSLVA